MYDLVIKGGRVIDPARNIDDQLDIGIQGNRIARVAKDIPLPENQQVVDAQHKIVTPGLIDLHCHVYDSILDMSVEPDSAGVKQAVTTVVDGGSAGQATFGGFPKYVIPVSRTTVLCFLHLGSLGLSIRPELRDWAEVDLDATAATIEAAREIIKGVKIRLIGNLAAEHGTEVVKIAKKVARNFNLPIMLHIGDFGKQVSPSLTQEVLPLLEPGDILSHVFTAKFGGIMRADGTVMPELKDAMTRGIVLDIAHGRMNLSYEVARKCMTQGVFPTTLSTDLTKMSLKGPVYGLTVTMSKFMALGLTLKQVIEMSTVNPARALGIEKRKGSLKPGMDADVSILELLSGRWELEDSEQQTIKAGQPITAQPIAQPQPLD